MWRVVSAAAVSSRDGQWRFAARLLLLLVLLLLPVLSLAPAAAGGGSQPGRADDEEVRRVFADYKAALTAGDGVAAAALVDQETLDYFAGLRDLAISGSEEQLRSRSFIDRLLVVSIRHVVAPDEVASLGLAALIERAVREGWISAQAIAQLEMGEVTIDGDHATGEVLTTAALGSPDAAAPVEGLVYRFAREEGRWRFGFSSLVMGLNRVIAELTEQLGTDEDALIFMLVESFSGRKVLPEVWATPDPDP